MTSLIERFGRNVTAGQVLFHEGEPGKEMFVIQSGKVRLMRNIRGVDKLLAELGAGEFFFAILHSAHHRSAPCEVRWAVEGALHFRPVGLAQRIR